MLKVQKVQQAVYILVYIRKIPLADALEGFFVVC